MKTELWTVFLIIGGCSIGWTGYLSFESNRKAGAHAKKTTKSV